MKANRNVGDEVRRELKQRRSAGALVHEDAVILTYSSSLMAKYRHVATSELADMVIRAAFRGNDRS